MKKVDLLIVGQGIAGTVLAYHALTAGLEVHVVDGDLPGSASRVAGGLINPVTGRRIRKSWQYDALFEELCVTYRNMEQLLGISCLHELPIYRLLPGKEDVNNWEIQRLEEAYKSVMGPVVAVTDNRVQPHEGAGVIKKGAWLDMVGLLQSFRNYLSDQGAFTCSSFDYGDIHGNTWTDYSFDKVVFCEGYKGINNPFFPSLSLRAAKGETAVITIEGNDLEYVINKNMLLIPLGNGHYKAGATVEHNESTVVTEKGRQELEEKISSVMAAPFRLIRQEAGIRPTVRDRKPLLGASIIRPDVYIFNGLGTKGVSLAPYFARQLLDHLLQGTPLQAEVDWRRHLT